MENFSQLISWRHNLNTKNSEESTKKEAVQSLKSISLINIDAKIINKIFTNRVNNVLREYYVMTK